MARLELRRRLGRQLGCDLDHPGAPGDAALLSWAVFVQLPGKTTTPTVLDSKDLLAADNQVLVEGRESPASPEIVEVVNRSLGRSPGERRRTRELLGVRLAGA